MARGGYIPDWQRALIALAGVSVAAATVVVLYWARSIFIPVALAVFLTFVLSPVVTWFQKRGLGRRVSVVLVVGLTLLTVGGLGTLIVQQVTALSKTLPDRRAEIVGKITRAKEAVFGTGDSRFAALITEVTEILVPKPRKADPDAPTVVVETPSPSWLAQAETFASPAMEVIGQAAFAFLLTVFMLLKREDLRNRMIRLTGHGKVTTTTKAVDDASRRVSRYLLTQLLLNTAFALVILVGLLLLGVSYALLWAVIAFVMRYVPYIGTWLGVIPPFLYTLAVADGWGEPLAVLALFIGLELVCNNFFEPMLYGPSMGLSEVAQLIAAGFWAFLWGPIGLILSGPLTVCLLVLGKYVSRFHFLEVLLGDEPALEPKVAFYQRLTARDQDEASLIALTALEGSDPQSVFDAVIVPALCLAKRDQQDGDLSDEDMRFAVRAAREIGDEVADERPEFPHPGDGGAAAPGERVPVLLCPARDEADRAAAELLARLLDPVKWEVHVAAVDTLASELVEAAVANKVRAVVIGSLPPGGMAHSRYLAARLKARLPDLKVIVGRWGRGEDFPDDPTRPVGGGADWVDGTLAETRKRLTEWSPVFTAGGPPPRPAAGPVGNGRPVGTAGATRV